jgi:hypothetical protein
MLNFACLWVPCGVQIRVTISMSSNIYHFLVVKQNQLFSNIQYSIIIYLKCSLIKNIYQKPIVHICLVFPYSQRGDISFYHSYSTYDDRSSSSTLYSAVNIRTYFSYLTSSVLLDQPFCILPTLPPVLSSLW